MFHLAQKRRGRSPGPLAFLLPWHLRPGGRLGRRRGGRLLLLRSAAELVQHAAAGAGNRRRGGRRRAAAVEDRTWLAVEACVPGQEQAGREEQRREDSRGPGQHIGGTAARHESAATAAAHAEPAAFG